MAYENILKAVNSEGKALSTKQQADNYSTFSELMKQGVYLPDLLKKIDALESRVDEMSKPKENPIDAELFAVMEQAVKDDPAVVEARRKLQAEKTRVISELCMQSEAYRDAFNQYRRQVNSSYVSVREEVKATPGE